VNLELARWTAILVAAHQINQVLDRLLGSVLAIVIVVAVAAAVAWGEQCKILLWDKLSLSYLLSRSWPMRSSVDDAG